MDVRSVIAHELGHLYANKYESTKIDGYKSTTFNINNNHPKLSGINGSVKNNLEEVVGCKGDNLMQEISKNVPLYVYEVFGLVAGCIFQVLYEKFNGRNYELAECFSFKQTEVSYGYADNHWFFVLNHSFKNEYGFVGKVDRLRFISTLPIQIYEMIVTENIPHNIFELTDEIFEKIKDSYDKEGFEYSLVGEDLEELIKKIDDSGFEVIDIIINKVLEKLNIVINE